MNSSAFDALTPADAGWLAQLDALLFGTEAWSEQLFADELAQPGRAWLSMQVGGQIVGYGGVMLEPMADVMSIGVFPQFQRRGYGRVILDELIRRAGEHQDEIFLEVRVDNDAAIAMYQAAGFEEIGRRPRYYQPSGLDAIVMRRTL